MSDRQFALLLGFVIVWATAGLNILQSPEDWHSPEDLRLLLLALVVSATAYVVARLPMSSIMRAVLAAILVAGEIVVFTVPVEQAATSAVAAEEARFASDLARERATARVAAAEKKVASAATSPRLEAAISSKRDVDAKAAEKAAERGCAQNCRMILEGQIAAATAEIDAARADVDRQRERVANELATARADLANLAPGPGKSGLAEALGLSSLTVAFILGLAKSIALNGAGAWLIWVGAHGRKAEPESASAPPAAAPNAEPERTAETLPDTEQRQLPPPPPPPPPPPLQRVTDEGQHVARFMLEMFDATGRARLRDVGQAYVWWCGKHGVEPLPMDRVAELFGDRVKRFKLTVENGEVAGLSLREAPRQLEIQNVRGL